MPLGPGSVSTSAALTNIAIQYRNPIFSMDQVFPSISVSKPSGPFWVFNKEDWTKARAGTRTNNGEFPRVKFRTSKNNYNTEVRGLGVEVTDLMRDAADSVIAPEINATNLSTDEVMRTRDIDIATAITGATWTAGSALAISAGSEWDTTGGGDPIGDWKTVAFQVYDSLGGRWPNTAVIPYKTLWALRLNPILRGLISGGATRAMPAILDVGVLKELLMIERIIVPEGSYSTNNEGGTFSTSDVMSDTVWIGWVAPSPSALAPSAGYVFEYQGRRVITYREENKGQKVVETQQAYEVNITALDAGQLITNTLA